MGRRRQTCPPSTDAYAVCSALLDLSASRPLPARGPLPSEFGYLRHEAAPRAPPRTPDRALPGGERRGVSAPAPRAPRRLTKPSPQPKILGRGSSRKPEHKWAHRLRLGWSRLRARLAAREAHNKGMPDAPTTPVECEGANAAIDWVDGDDGVHVFLWDESGCGTSDEADVAGTSDASDASAASSVSVPLFFSPALEWSAETSAELSIMVTPPSPCTPRTPRTRHARTEPDTPTPAPRGTPSLFPPSNPRFRR